MEEEFQESMNEYSHIQRAIQNSIKRENLLSPEQRYVNIFNHQLASSESPDDPAKIGQIYVHSLDTLLASKALQFVQDKIWTSSANSVLNFIR